MKTIVTLIAIVLIVAAATKPDETKLTSEFGKKKGSWSSAGAILGHVTGYAPMAYHDYLFLSTETQSADTVAVGFLGRVVVL